MNTAPPRGTVLVTGATGFLGMHLVEALLAEGWTVRTLARRATHPALAAWSNHPRVETAIGNLTAPETLPEALAGVAAVVHAAAHVSFLARDREAMRQANALGTGALVDAALSAGTVRKLVYVSSVAALGRPDTPTGFYTEDLRWTKSRRNTHYGYTKYLGEKEVNRGVAEGLPAVILNPTIILGSGLDWRSGSLAFFRSVDRGLPVYPIGMNGFVGVWDVARACALALDSPLGDAERFILCSENLYYKDLLGLIAAALQRPAPRWALPAAPSIALGWWSERLANLLGTSSLFTAETMRTGAGVSRYDNSRARQTLGLDFTPIAEVVRRTAQAYRQAFPR